MNTRLPKIYHLIPVAYLLFIAVLVVLNFSGESSFNETSGGLRIQGKAAARTGRGQGISEARIEFRGVVFSFGAGQDVQIVGTDGSTYPVTVNGYTKEANGFTVAFDRGISARFSRESSPVESLDVSIVMSADTAEISTVRIPYDVKGSNTLFAASLLPVALVDSNNGDFGSFISLPYGSFIDPVSRTIGLSASKLGVGGITITERLSADEDPFAYWFAMNVPSIPDAVYRDSVADFLNRSYQGWRTGRYDSANGRWSFPDGSEEFSEPIAAAYLAESLTRGEYSSAFAQVTAASERNPGNVTFLSAPFLGNVVDSTRDLQSQDAAKIERVKNLVSSRDTALFEIPNVLAFTADRSPFSVVQEFMQFTSSIDLDEPSIAQCVGIAETWRDGSDFDSQIEEATRNLEEVVVSRILPAMAATAEGLFLVTEENSSDLALNLRAGAVLLEGTFGEDEEIMRRIGKDLVTTTLALADRNGNLPERVLLKDGRVESYAGSLAAESVYVSVSPNRYYPREVSLYQILAPGAWMWTAAEIDTIITGTDSYRLRVRFPRDGIHHLVLQGIKPFNSVEMFGRVWVSDPRFQDYYSGWFYNGSTETLYMKIRHTDEVEEIIFRY